MEELVEKGLSTSDRLERAKSLPIPRITYLRSFAYTTFQSSGSTKFVAIDSRTGRADCTCEDHWFSGGDGKVKILCKHLLRMLGAGDMTVLRQFTSDKTDITKVVPTGITGLDKLLFGGLSTHYNTLIYSDWGVGKSLFALQVAAKVFYDTNLSPVYIDSESNWISKLQRDAWLDRFAARYGKKERAEILFVYPRSIEELFEYFGMTLAITDTGTKKKAVYGDMEKGKKGKEIITFTEDDNPAINDVRENKSPLLILDSISHPMKGKVPVPPNENNPTKSALIYAMMERTHYIAVTCGIPSLVTAHLSKDQALKYNPARAHGGSTVGFNAKWLIYLQGGRGDVETVGFGNRVFIRDRTPSFSQSEIALKLVKNYGYADYEVEKLKK